MARLTNGAFVSKIQEQYAVEPILAVGLIFAGETIWFGTKKTQNVENRIISAGAATCERRDDNYGTTGSLSVTLDDSDGRLKAMIDSFPLEQVPAIVTIGFEDMDQVTLLHGRVMAPTWDEGQRTLQISIEATATSQEVGHSVTDEFSDVSPSAIGVPWPMIFGKCANVPALKVRQHTIGVLLADIRLVAKDDWLYKMNQSRTAIILNQTCGVETVDKDGIVKDKIYIENGSSFPQNQSVKISIDRVIFQGKFSDEVFTVEKANLPFAVNIPFAPRGSDEDKENPVVGWIGQNDADNYDFTGCFLYLHKGSGNTINCFYCVRQEGTKLWFSAPLRHPVRTNNHKAGTPDEKPYWLVAADTKITEAYHNVANNGLIGQWPLLLYQYYNESITLTRPAQFPTPAGTADKKVAVGTAAALLDTFAMEQDLWWTKSSGEKIRLWDTDPDIYIASLVQLQQINGVYGKRTVRYANGSTAKVFAQIPKSYYKTQLTSNYQVNGNYASGLLFYVPLSEHKDEDWEDDIFVSATSTVGPAIEDVIRYILSYTNLTISSLQTANNDCNFALLQQTNALKLAQDIAWQARSALRLDSDFVDVIYLADPPVSVLTFDENNVDAASVELSTTSTHEISTKLVSRWNKTYRNRPSSSILNSNQFHRIGDIIAALATDKYRDEIVSVYRNNIDRYGEQTRDVQIFIFNEEDSVMESLRFWGYRYSNSWRKITFRSYLQGLLLQTFDGITLRFNSLGNLYGVPAQVESVQYNHSDKTTTIVAWIPIIAGSTFISSEAYPG